MRMYTIVLEVQNPRTQEWNVLNTQPYDPELKHNQNWSTGVIYCKEGAKESLIKAKGVWSQYHTFEGCQMRIVDPMDKQVYH